MKLNLLALLLFVSISASAQSYSSVVAAAEKFYADKDYPNSVLRYQEAFKLKSTEPGDLYNAACSASLSGNVNLAFDWLNQAMANGWLNIKHLNSDTDLNALHSDARWSKLTAAMQAGADKREASYDKPLRDRLLTIYEDDQNVRRQFVEAEKKYGFKSKQVDSLVTIMIRNDRANLKKVTDILDTYGWVGADKVGGQANQTLFLVIQHADLKTQQKYLPMMREAVKNKNAQSSALALLEDRVALGEGRRQIYGSQIGQDEKTQKHYVLPLHDPDHVDQRRAEVGLGPLADYVSNWDIVWDVAEYKKQLPEIEARQKH